MKKQFLIIVIILVSIQAFGGIYRHDVSARKYKELAMQKQFDCVGQVMDSWFQSAKGSCVLIGNKYVLSAAHCFINTETRVDTLYLDQNGKSTTKLEKGGATMWVNQPVHESPARIEDYSFRFNGRKYIGKTMKIYHSYLDSLNQGTTDFSGDLVLIELTDTVEGVIPAMLNTHFDERNVVITGVGYGASGPADNAGDVGPFGEKIAGQNVVDEIAGFEVNGRPSLLAFDFDHPTRKDRNRMGSAKPLPLEWGPGGGDSGGGLFRQVNNKWELVGIITGGPRSGLDMAHYMKTKGFYGGISENARVSVFSEWIKETIEEFGQQETKIEIKLN